MTTQSLPVTDAKPATRRQGFRGRQLVLLALVALLTWIAVDLYAPRKTDFRHFDGVATGRIEADMWRSYYERRPVRLFWQLAGSLRTQFHAGFWRSFPMAYRAAKAAFVFKDGRNRDDYAKALPYLNRYFEEINALSLTPFDVKSVAHDELEWWIIRRERDRFTTADWERLLASVAGQIYHIPNERAAKFAKLRVDAMVLRDQRGSAITEQDWTLVQNMLETGWSALASELR